MKSKVYITFCMDTEGPCDDPGNDELLKNWESVDFAMAKLFDKNFRSLYKDSSGNDFKVGWFFLTWTGFKTNPRGRDFGYHKVRDHYRGEWGGLIDKYGDEECWHYHHPPKSGIGNEWSTNWSSSCEYQNIISKQIIEREWFPVCFRAGGTIMDSELSKWVDKWFPFDYSNRAPLKFNEMDWSDGLTDWQPYQPDPIEFKRKGNGKRYMTRCMDLKTGLFTISEKDIIQAFKEASLKGSSILSVFDHDYRDIENRIKEFLHTVNLVAHSFPEVAWEYASPSEAIIKNVGGNIEEQLRLEAVLMGDILKINSSSRIHQKCPWVAVEHTDGLVKQIESGLEKISENTWKVELDSKYSLRTIGVAASNELGHFDITNIKIN
ncbi:uncharacterized protein METZ01_LOCUS154813 [marine metagenome]|uniref:NodB homology domain-containing protein n=1 Tax=marine metagenome TaxID=408172 RepID=A0A382AKP2_9ZZZZ